MWRIVGGVCLGLGTQYRHWATPNTVECAEAKAGASTLDKQRLAAEYGDVVLQTGKAAGGSGSPTGGAVIPGQTNPTEDMPPVDPVKILIVGGGYSGAKLASLLDSIFAVTLVDTKNYNEFAPDLVPILCSKWSDVIEEALNKYLVLHRFFLRRANVVTGKAVKLSGEQTMVLDDGREVPFDMMVLATGQEKAFPFSSSNCRTLNQRKDEIKHLNKFIESECHRVAVVGGGPLGVTTASQLAHNYPEKKVVLYSATPTLLPQLPHQVGRKASDLLKRHKNIEVRYNSRVTKVDRVNHGAQPAAVTPETTETKEKNSSGGVSSWLFGKGTNGKNAKGKLDDQFHVTFESLTGEKEKLNSVLHQWWFNSPPVVTTAGDTVASTNVEGEFDYVFNCIGTTPRNETFLKDEILKPHLDGTKRFHVSKMNQLLGHPNYFAVGGCNSLPFLNSYGNHDIQVRTLFRNFYSVLTTPDSAPVKTFEGNGLVPHRMQIPRMLLLMFQDEALGSTSWGGAVVGHSALGELLQDRCNLLQAFSQPMFYRPHEPRRVRKLVDEWLSKEVTDAEDFVN